MEENTLPGNPAPQEDIFAEYSDGVRQLEMDSYRTAVRKARNALFVAGGLLILGEIISIFRQPELQNDGSLLGIVIAIAAIEGGIFFALGLWTSKKPYTAIIIGLIAFIGVIIFSAVVNGYTDGGAGVLSALFSGILIKVLILINLIRPLKDAKALQEAMEEDKRLSV